MSFEKLCLNAMFSVYFQLLLQSLLFLLLSFLLSGQPLFSPHKQINLQIKLRGWGLSLFNRASAGFDQYVLVLVSVCLLSLRWTRGLIQSVMLFLRPWPTTGEFFYFSVKFQLHDNADCNTIVTVLLQFKKIICWTEEDPYKWTGELRSLFRNNSTSASHLVHGFPRQELILANGQLLYWFPVLPN